MKLKVQNTAHKGKLASESTSRLHLPAMIHIYCTYKALPKTINKYHWLKAKNFVANWLRD